MAQPWRPALRGFAIDLLLATVLVFGLSLAGVVAWTLVRGVQLGLAGGATGDPRQLAAQIGEPHGTALILISVMATALAALLLYFWRRRASAAERMASLAAARRPSTWGWAALAGLAAFAFSVAVTTLGQQAGIEQVPTNQPLIEAMGARHPAMLLLLVVLLAPAYEELLFRRVLFGRLWAAGRPLPGLVLSSAAFACMHELPGTGGNGLLASSLLWICYAVMGALFAWVYRATGTLWAAIGAHALNNLIAGALLLWGAH
ncbi:MAG: CPBP family intramembrane metalloprotease [Luteimonas sp.]|nr:CPBP family intramembrane metalloprotease [Luteimonas sp.]